MSADYSYQRLSSVTYKRVTTRSTKWELTVVATSSNYYYYCHNFDNLRLYLPICIYLFVYLQVWVKLDDLSFNQLSYFFFIIFFFHTVCTHHFDPPGVYSTYLLFSLENCISAHPYFPFFYQVSYYILLVLCFPL